MMINLAGHYYPPNTKKVLSSLETDVHPHMISSPDIFQEYQKIQQSEFISSMLMTHLADKHLSANGIIVFNGSRETLLGGSKKALPMH